MWYSMIKLRYGETDEGLDYMLGHRIGRIK